MSARSTVWPPDVEWSEALGSSPAVTAGGWIFTSDHQPTDFVAPLAPAATIAPGDPYGRSPIELEASYVLAALGRTLRAAGADLRTDAARMYWWLRADRPALSDFEDGSNWTGIEDLSPIHEARERAVAQPAPGSTGIGVRQLPASRATLATSVIAFQPGSGKQGVEQPPELPQLPDNPAVRVGDWVFTVGLIASDWTGDFGATVQRGRPGFLDPAARVNPYVWFGSDVEAQTEHVLDGLAAVAQAAGTSLDRCVKAEVYFGHPRDLYAIERAWRRRWPSNPPARTLVPYGGLAGMGCRVEIALTLLAGDAPIETVETSSAPEPAWHEPQAVRAGGMLFLSNRLPVDDAGRVPVELTERCDFPYLVDRVRAQSALVIEHVAAICAAGGAALDDVCRRMTVHDDLRNLPAAVAEWRRHFEPRAAPAASDVGLGPGWPLLAPGALLQVDVIAHAG